MCVYPATPVVEVEGANMAVTSLGTARRVGSSQGPRHTPLNNLGEMAGISRATILNK